MSSEADLLARIDALQLELRKRGLENETLERERVERVLLARGEYFTQLQDVLGTERADFTGGFLAICGRMQDSGWREKRPAEYTTLELELLAKVKNENEPAENMSYTSTSASSRESITQKGGMSKLSQEDKEVIADKEKNEHLRARSSSGLSRKSQDKATTNTDPGVKLIDGGTVTNAAHLLAGNVSCSPTMGIFAQAIVGFDFEAEMNGQFKTASKKEKEKFPALSAKEKREMFPDLAAKEKRVLQNLAYHQRDFKGFCNLANNLIQIPKGGHEKFFDIDCHWIIAPIMPLEKIINWHPQMGGYWVMVIAGSFTERDTQAYVNLLQASSSEKKGEHVYIQGERERCSEVDIERGIANLSAFIKAFADLATGRKANKEQEEGKLTPFDLIEDDAPPANLETLKAARNRLARDWEVTVPTLRAFDEQQTQVLKVFIDNENPALLPEPMAVAAKGALNLMEMNGERAVPACGESSVEDDSDASSSIDQLSMRTPSASWQERSDIPEYVSIVTPSP